MRSTSVAQRLNSFQSSFGAPSSSQMIGIGYGSQMSTATSARPVRGDGVDEPADDLAHERPQPVGGPRRERLADEPPQPRVLVALRRQDRRAPPLEVLRVGDPRISMIRDVALCQRLSRSIATTSS